MQAQELNAEPRGETGKSANRRLRRGGRIPGIVYGAAKEPQAVSLSHDEVLRQLQREAFYSSILTINVNAGSEQVVVKALQRHPYKPEVLHIDFQRIDEKQKITMRVPIHFVNERECVGVKTGGGIVSHIMTELEISCLPRDLPEYIEVDVARMDVGETLHLGDIALPEGVELYALQHGGDADSPVVSITVPKVVEEAEEAADGEEEALAEGAEETAADAEKGKASEEPAAEDK